MKIDLYYLIISGLVTVGFVSAMAFALNNENIVLGMANVFAFALMNIFIVYMGLISQKKK